MVLPMEFSGIAKLVLICSQHFLPFYSNTEANKDGIKSCIFTSSPTEYTFTYRILPSISLRARHHLPHTESMQSSLHWKHKYRAGWVTDRQISSWAKPCRMGLANWESIWYLLENQGKEKYREKKYIKLSIQELQLHTTLQLTQMSEIEGCLDVFARECEKPYSFFLKDKDSGFFFAQSLHCSFTQLRHIPNYLAHWGCNALKNVPATDLPETRPHSSNPTFRYGPVSSVLIEFILSTFGSA